MLPGSHAARAPLQGGFCAPPLSQRRELGRGAVGYRAPPRCHLYSLDTFLYCSPASCLPATGTRPEHFNGTQGDLQPCQVLGPPAAADSLRASLGFQKAAGMTSAQSSSLESSGNLSGQLQINALWLFVSKRKICIYMNSHISNPCCSRVNYTVLQCIFSSLGFFFNIFFSIYYKNTAYNT